MIGIEEVEKIHDILIERFGGAKGIRDNAGLLMPPSAGPIKHLTVKSYIHTRWTKPQPFLKVLYQIILLLTVIKEQLMS